MNKKLYFREDGTFKLMQLTDLHYENKPEQDGKCLALMRELIEAEQPDYIMVTGDAVHGEHAVEDLDKALAPVTESGIPWGFAFGNHDAEHADNKQELFDRLVQMPGSMVWHDPHSGDGMANGYVELCGRDGEAQWLLFGIDSGHALPDKPVGGYGYVTRHQMDWYRSVIAGYEEKGRPFSSMVYMHVALPEHEETWKHEVCYGMRREGDGYSRLNSGFFFTLLEAGHTKGVFVGHAHVNDYWGRLYGIALGYGRMTGFGSYAAQDFLRGCRMFRFRDGDTENFETYERLQYGIVVSEPWTQHPFEQRDEG